jgi:hypothetical protein
MVLYSTGSELPLLVSDSKSNLADGAWHEAPSGSVGFPVDPRLSNLALEPEEPPPVQRIMEDSPASPRKARPKTVRKSRRGVPEPAVPTPDHPKEPSDVS